MNADKDKILITGATGNVGRHVVAQLLRAGARVRALTRNPDSARLPGGVELAHGDLSIPETLDVCWNGVEAAFLIWPFFTAEGAKSVVDLVTKHCRRIVFLSALTVRDDSELQTDPIFHADIERLIEQSGIEWTFLRCSGFATNALWWAPQIHTNGVVRGPYGSAARSLVHECDIASVGVLALTGDRHGGKKYVLTGPQSLTQIEQVDTIGEAIGRRLRWEEISPEVARQQMLTSMPPSFADAALNYWAKLVTEPEPVTRTVEEVTGLSARPFREWAIEHASDFRL